MVGNRARKKIKNEDVGTEARSWRPRKSKNHESGRPSAFMAPAKAKRSELRSP